MPGCVFRDMLSPMGHPAVCVWGVLPKGPQGSPSRLPSPRRWESELRLFSAESWSVLTKLCLRRDGAEPPRAAAPRGRDSPFSPVPCLGQTPPGQDGALGAGWGGSSPTGGVTSGKACCPSRSRCR